MRSSALFTVVLVGAGTVASAQPRQEETSGRISYKQQTPAPPRRPAQWVQLATPTPARHGTEFIVIGKDAGYFSQLRVSAVQGSTVVRRVKVIFADGTTKTMEVDRSIGGQRSAQIDLREAKAIDRVVVTTDATNGEYAIYGAPSPGAVVKR